MHVLLLGATGRIGALAVTAALAAGHSVNAIVRDPTGLAKHPRVTVIEGGAADAAALAAGLEGVDAVISALGPRANRPEDAVALERAMRALVAGMSRQGVSRLITLSGAGITVPGDRKPALDRLASALVRRLARHVVAAKQREYDIFSRSQLAWTAVRPPLVRDGAPVGYRLATTLTPGARVTRADTAAALVDQLADATFVGQAPFVLPPRR
jgi:putative NADH-flavin reductase